MKEACGRCSGGHDAADCTWRFGAELDDQSRQGTALASAERMFAEQAATTKLAREGLPADESGDQTIVRVMAKLRGRMAVLERAHAAYLTYLQSRIEDRDWHAVWDCGVNLSETECELAGLRFALEAFGG